MQFLCFKPERSSLRFQFRHRPNNHPKKMLGFARFFPSSSDVFQKFLFGNCVVGFDVVSADTSAGANELIDDLSLVYNKARQDAITKELLDIAGGAEALAQARVAR